MLHCFPIRLLTKLFHDVSTSLSYSIFDKGFVQFRGELNWDEDQLIIFGVQQMITALVRAIMQTALEMCAIHELSSFSSISTETTQSLGVVVVDGSMSFFGYIVAKQACPAP